MAFEIYFTGDPDEYLHDDPTIPTAIGRITAGDLQEEFASSLYEWNKEACQFQWLQSLERFLNEGEKAVLITSYVNPRESSNLEWRALYRGESDIIYVQNHLPWYSQFDREFSVAEASSFLRDRITVDEDGDTLSEWDVPLKEVERFF